jgi:YjbE family integral membrane protein
VRSVMTAAVVWLLKIPGLLLVGGALLVWIAWRLIAEEEDDSSEHGPAATTFWGAMRTIVIADAVMGMDNVLAVAGAAHGSYLLVVLGLLISVPIVMWGSSFVLKIVERFPIVIYLGAGVLLWTAAKMMLSEPIVKPVVAQAAGIPYAVYVALAALLAFGYWRNEKRKGAKAKA